MPSRCSRCYSCIPACPENAIQKDNSGAIAIDRAKCNLCGKCVEACLFDALLMAGREVTVADILAEVEKDRIFYDQSGGGATLTGGEPLSQPEFAEELLDVFRVRNIHSSLDTSGYAPAEIFMKIASKADLVLFDLKLMSDARHRRSAGVSNRLIRENLKALAGSGKDIDIRIPLVPGINDDDDNLEKTAAFLSDLKNIRKISFLPYHKGGVEKSKRLGKEASFHVYDVLPEPRIEAISGAFKARGFEVKRGG
jgi:pyruvate formate lyase activating enzyme